VASGWSGGSWPAPTHCAAVKLLAGRRQTLIEVLAGRFGRGATMIPLRLISPSRFDDW
jgi:hypothetical protein